MIKFSYNISDKFNTYLSKIEDLRIEILTTPLTPKNELRLKWDANLERIIWSLSLLDNSISKKEATNLLTKYAGKPKKKLSSYQKEVLNQRKVFGYIRENWLGSKSVVTMPVIKKLYEISCRETDGKMTGLTEYSEKRVDEVLNYLQKGSDHPIIQAGIIQFEIMNIKPFDNGNGKIARLLSYIFLYKSGYDIRDMLIFEAYLKKDEPTFRRVLDLTRIQNNLTVWLEYFSFAIAESLQQVLNKIKNEKFTDELPSSFWKLTGRQRQILEYLETPGVHISNKDVKKMCGVSQITASRDLAKLTSVGLLFAHGKGRSVYYTRV
jgi:Fic family protein